MAYIVTGKDIEPIIFSMKRTGIMLTGMNFLVGNMSNGTAASCRTRDRAEVWINFTEDHAGNEKFKDNVPIFWGLFAHEMMHVLVTDFDYEIKALQNYPSPEERKARHEMVNIVEDPAIEYMSSDYLPGFLVECLRKTIVTLARRSIRIEAGKTAYEQLLIALVQFGDIGILYGYFTFPQAEEIFVKTAPIMNRAIEETSYERRFDYAMQIFDMAYPLWKELMKNAGESSERMKDLLNKMGKQSPVSGSGKALQKLEQESKQPENSSSFGPQVNQDPQQGNDPAPSKSGISGNREDLIRQMGNESSTAGKKNAKDEKTGEDEGSSQSSKTTEKGINNDPNCGKHQSTKQAESIEELIDTIEKTCGQDTELSEQTGKYLNDMEQQAKEQMKREEKRNLKNAELENINIKVKSPYLQRDIPYINREVRDGSISAYEQLVDSCGGNIHGLASQLKRIFQEDRARKSYTTCGRFSVKRASSDRITARLFTKKIEPDNKIDMSVLILLDQSGSMRGSKIDNAQKCACMLAEALGRFHIQTKIVGFTTHDMPVFTHYGSWKNTVNDRKNLTSMYSTGGTFLGYSIRYAGELLKRSRTKHKIMIVITDGRPEDPHYKSPEDAFGDVADAVRGVKKYADMIGIGLFNGSVYLNDIYEKIFGRDFLSLQKADDLPPLVSQRMRAIVKSW